MCFLVQSLIGRYGIHGTITMIPLNTLTEHQAQKLSSIKSPSRLWLCNFTLQHPNIEAHIFVYGCSSTFWVDPPMCSRGSTQSFLSYITVSYRPSPSYSTLTHPTVSSYYGSPSDHKPIPTVHTWVKSACVVVAPCVKRVRVALCVRPTPPVFVRLRPVSTCRDQGSGI